MLRDVGGHEKRTIVFGIIKEVDRLRERLRFGIVGHPLRFGEFSSMNYLNSLFSAFYTLFGFPALPTICFLVMLDPLEHTMTKNTIPSISKVHTG